MYFSILSSPCRCIIRCLPDFSDARIFNGYYFISLHNFSIKRLLLNYQSVPVMQCQSSDAD